MCFFVCLFIFLAKCSRQVTVTQGWLAVECSHPLKHERQGDIHAIPASHLGGVQLLQMLISLLTF